LGSGDFSCFSVVLFHLHVRSYAVVCVQVSSVT
jgi:hypothetical protein